MNHRSAIRIVAHLLWLSTLATSSAAIAQVPVAPTAKVEKLAGDFRFTEGPACDGAGNVYFTDIPNSRIWRWTVAGKLEKVREQTGRANGLYFDRDGNLLACEGGARRLTSMSSDGKITVLASTYQAKRFNSPNDLWISPTGSIYFTDPRYGDEEDLEQDGFHVYFLARPGAEPRRLIADLKKPNGIIGTSDGKWLYVADPGDNKTYRYHIAADGQLSERKLFAESGSDGMTLDERGNLYLTRDAVLVFDADGKQLGQIEVPERPANVCFGGAQNNELFITARTGLYRIKMAVQGQPSWAK